MKRFVRSWLIAMLAVGLVATVACKKKGAEAGKPEAGKAGAPAGIDVGTIAAPATVVAYGAIKSLDEFTGAVAGLVGKFQPGMAAMVGAQIPALLQGQVLGAKDMNWFDAKKPIKFAILDYKQFPKPFAVLLPVKAKDALAAALPETKAAGAPDNELKFPSPLGLELYLNHVGEYVVVTAEPKAFAAVKAFVEGDLAKAEFVELVDIHGAIANLRKVAGEDLQAAKAAMLQAAQAPSPIPMPGMDKLLQQEIELFMEVLDQTDAARIVLKYDGNDLAMNTSIKVVDGKGLAKFAAGTKDRKIELHKKLPAGGWLTVAQNIDPKAFEAWTQLGLDFYAGFLQLTDEEKTKLKGLMTQMMDLETGEMAMSIGRDGDFPARVLAITGMKDGEKGRALFFETMTMIFTKLGAAVEKYAGPDATRGMPKLDWSSFKNFMEGMKPILGQVGVTAEFTASKAGNAAVDALVLSVDYAKIPGADSPEVASVSKALGNKLGFAVGADKGALYFTMGKDAVGDVGKLSTEAGAGGGALGDAMAKSGTNAAIAGWLSIIDLLKIVAVFAPEINAAIPNLATIPADAGISFVVGGHGERIIDASIALPITKIAALVPKPGAAPAGAPVAPAP
jgi:hypothetical protein